MDLSHLCNIAIEAAFAAGKIIKRSINKEIIIKQKKGAYSYAAEVLTEVDIAAEKEILAHLFQSYDEFNIALLSEEREDDGSRFEADYFWCIDPMDGTLAFINKHPGFSVSIALVAKDGTPHIGVVFDPSTDTMYHAVKGIGAFKNGSPLKINNVNKYLTYVTDKKLKDTTRSDEIETLLNDKAVQLNLNGVNEMAGGGAVMNAIQVIENGPACMLKFPKKENGGGSIWDYAATACIYHELGLRASNFEGGPLDLNKKDGAFMNHEGVFYANW